FVPSADTLVEIPASSNFEDAGLDANTTNYYAVNELHDDGSETAVDPQRAKRVLDRFVPGAPVNGSATDINDIEIQVTWMPADTKATTFVIQRSPNGTDSWSMVANVTTKSKK